MIDIRKLTKHYSGIYCGNYRKVKGSAGVNVDHFYYDPKTEKIELCHNNTHYGYAHVGDDGLLYDNSNRAVFAIV